jgi:hypothetical protein
VIDLGGGQCQAEPDGVGEVRDIEQLVTVAATANHWKVAAIERPVIEQGKDAKSLRSHE